MAQTLAMYRFWVIAMARAIYTQEMLKFIAKAYKAKSLDDTVIAFNKKFGLAKTKSQIKAAINNHGIKCGRKPGELNKGKSYYSNEQLQFLRDNYVELSAIKLTEAFNKRFGENKGVEAIRGVLFRHKIQSGRDGQFNSKHEPWNKGLKGWSAGGRSVETRFKKGESTNKRPVGSTRICKQDGYLLVKTAEPNVWRLAHLVLWEKHHGKVPESHRVFFRDNDKSNITIENLMLISKKEAMAMVRLGVQSVSAELKDTAVLLANLNMKEIELRREIGA